MNGTRLTFRIRGSALKPGHNRNDSIKPEVAGTSSHDGGTVAPLIGECRNCKKRASVVVSANAAHIIHGTTICSRCGTHVEVRRTGSSPAVPGPRRNSSPSIQRVTRTLSGQKEKCVRCGQPIAVELLTQHVMWVHQGFKCGFCGKFARLDGVPAVLLAECRRTNDPDLAKKINPPTCCPSCNKRPEGESATRRRTNYGAWSTLRHSQRH